MPVTTAVDYDPFAPVLTPVDHDPFADEMSPQQVTQAATALNPTAPTGLNPGSVLPMSEDSQGDLRFDPNAGMLGSLRRGAALHRDVYSGLIDPNSPDGFNRVIGLAGMAGLGGLLALKSAPISAAKTLEKKVVSGYDPPAKTPRAFEADYPAGATADEAGNLTRDIDGNPLGAQYIVGRRILGGADEALSPTETLAVGTQATGSGPLGVAAGQIGGNAGQLRRTINAGTGSPQYRIFVDKSLPNDKRDLVVSHEVGHALDDIAGQIPTSGLSKELRTVYGDLNNPNLGAYGKAFGPEQAGYKGTDISREMMAEAIRAYMTNPNYLKTVAPKTATAIRGAVNAHPQLSKTIQFNSGGLPLFLTPVDHDPFEDK